MKRTFIKTILRDFKKNLTRLIAIVAIMALGVGFLIGLLSATPDLQDSMERYYDETNLYDISIKSTIGFSKDDILSLKTDVKEIKEIEEFSSMDFKTYFEGVEITTRRIVNSFEAKLNQLTLIEGEYPKTSTECVVQNMGIFLDKHPIHQQILVDGITYTIVGICNSPMYYYRMQETTQIGDGNLDAILYLDQAFFSAPITDIVITVDGAKELHSFKKAYFEFIEPVEDKLEELSISYIEKRMDSLYATAKEEARKKILEVSPNLPDSMVDSILEAQSEEIKKSVDEQFTEMKWYVLDRKSNLSYVSFDANANKVNNVAVVFPFFFFFIAALIALTSVTRLVQEDRSSIGTLKSLGYSNLRILNKYFVYALFACLIGSAGGLFLGVYGLPMAIYYCYCSLFIMPQGHFSWYAWCVLFSSVSMSATIFVVMIAVCLKSLMEKPNALLVPKAPKAGRRILLERIGFIWKRLKFKYKSSIRNIFRFKRNLIMMIVGVGGCTGLMIVGLGLRDSLSSASTVQFEEVLKYDFSLSIQGEVKLDFLQDSEITYLYKEEGKLKKNKEYSIDILYAEDTLLDYMSLGVKEIPTDSVIISSQLAKNFHLRKGSSIVVDVNGKEKEFKVHSVFDNYIRNYIITKRTDEKENTIFLKLGAIDSQNYDTIVRKVYEVEGVASVSDLNQTKELYASLSNGISLIIVVIILCSGLLAIIVIYNLTNININERIKEIATLKVLGYQKKEVLGYIYREIILMSIFGILFGFGLGPLLNLFVIKQISSPGQCFSTALGGLNYLYAFLITAVFVGIVLLLFIPKMKKIKMVESLKSVE
ncbi:MAG: FtsX-like permease family protein [Anaeroplasmataceae bacterium]|nr:FtsX-like permease family protein [Anaeroplasmataceae bacterium]MDE6414598.1 FtsX-like permease family protein [Anaeroplasmataceae bacterium]